MSTLLCIYVYVHLVCTNQFYGSSVHLQPVCTYVYLYMYMYVQTSSMVHQFISSLYVSSAPSVLYTGVPLTVEYNVCVLGNPKV